MCGLCRPPESVSRTSARGSSPCGRRCSSYPEPRGKRAGQSRLQRQAQCCTGPGVLFEISRASSVCRCRGRFGEQGTTRGLKRQVPIAALAPLCRQRWGQEPAPPPHMLLLSDGHLGLGPRTAEAALTMASQRFYHILHVAASAGEHEKVVQVTSHHHECFWGAGTLASGCVLCPESGRRFRRCQAQGETGWEHGVADTGHQGALSEMMASRHRGPGGGTSWCWGRRGGGQRGLAGRGGGLGVWWGSPLTQGVTLVAGRDTCEWGWSGWTA